MDDFDKLDGHNEPAVVDDMDDICKYYKAAHVTTIFLFSMSVEATQNSFSFNPFWDEIQAHSLHHLVTGNGIYMFEVFFKSVFSLGWCTVNKSSIE